MARASEDMAEKHLLKAGADAVVSPYVFAGQRIAQSFLRPHVVSFLDAATTHLGMDLEIEEVSISAGSVFAGQTVESSRIRQDRGVIILAIKREAGMHFNPAPDDTHRGGRLPDRHGRAAATARTGTDRRDRRHLGPTMKIVSAAEMRAIDRATSERFGVPSLTLMENAGSAVARFILSRISACGAHRRSVRQGQQRRRWLRGGPQIGRAGRAMRVLLLADPSELRGDAAAMFERMTSGR